MQKIICFVLCALLLSTCTIKPIPITYQERKLRLVSDLQNLFKDQEEIKGPVTLHEAIARTLKYNMDYRIKLMEEAVERGSLKITRFDLLPVLTANAGYHNRSEFTGATSQSLIDGSQSLVASTSQEKTFRDASLGPSWNILDFGVSFVRAKQQANQLLIANELRRKAIQNIVLDVINAYWRVVAVQAVKNDFEAVLAGTLAAMKRAEKIEAELLQLPLKSLQNQQSLLDLNQKLLDFEKRMKFSMFQLASLMNLKLGTNYEVVIPEKTTLPVIPVGSIEAFEETALLSRSELREGDYKKRISRLEVRKAILQMLPGIDLNATRNHTSNKFTFNADWNELTIRLTYNIFNLFLGPARWQFAKTMEKLEDVRRLALSMNVLTQVHLSLQDYRQSLQNYQLAKKQQNVKDRIAAQIEAARKAETTDELQSILGKMRKLSAKMRSGLTYAELQGAAARIYHTIGMDRMPAEVEGYDIPDLAKAIKAAMEKGAILQREVVEGEVKEPKQDNKETTEGKEEIMPAQSVVEESASDEKEKERELRKTEREAKKAEKEKTF